MSTTSRLSKEEIGEAGRLIYETKLQADPEASSMGQFVAIDIETGDYGVASEAMDAADRLKARSLRAFVYQHRIGHTACVFIPRLRLDVE